MKHLTKRFKVPIADGKYVEVSVWDTVGSMQKANGLGENVGGYAIQSTYASGNGKLYVPKRFAEMHLFEDGFGVGVVAHEMQHILNMWILTWGLDVDKDDEIIAKLAGILNNGFWIAWKNLENS